MSLEEVWRQKAIFDKGLSKRALVKLETSVETHLPRAELRHSTDPRQEQTSQHFQLTTPTLARMDGDGVRELERKLAHAGDQNVATSS
jgi:hypothetical protein